MCHGDSFMTHGDYGNILAMVQRLEIYSAQRDIKKSTRLLI